MGDEVSAVRLPGRPSWVCADDRQEWPCFVYKRRLWSASGGNTDAMAEHMSGWMGEARTHLVALSAVELQARFVNWITTWPDEPAPRVSTHGAKGQLAFPDDVPTS